MSSFSFEPRRFESRPVDRRAAGALCPQCGQELRTGQRYVTCVRCGALHHETCWVNSGGCGSYECAPAQRDPAHLRPTLTITHEELRRAKPLDETSRPAPLPLSTDDWNTRRSRSTNGVAVAALVVGLLSLLPVGCVTGFGAIVLGVVALGSVRRYNERGTGLAVAGLLLGLVGITVWLAVAWRFWTGHRPAVVAVDEFQPDPASIEHLAPHIRRAMKANAWIEVGRGLANFGLGSGVVLKLTDGWACIVTNRHVVQPGAADGAVGPTPRNLDSVRVLLLGQPRQSAQLLWVAPAGIDLALIRVPVVSNQVQAALYWPQPELVVGQEVFAVGNPEGLGWTHTSGVISQLRFQEKGPHRLRIIQTSTAINPGNSGGGLYTKQGILIGINTWTHDKRFSEGLSFAIAFEELLKLVPRRFQLTPQQAEKE